MWKELGYDIDWKWVFDDYYDDVGSFLNKF